MSEENNCPHCGASRRLETYRCGVYCIAPSSRTEWCIEREALQKAQAEIKKLQISVDHFTDQALHFQHAWEKMQPIVDAANDRTRRAVEIAEVIHAAHGAECNYCDRHRAELDAIRATLPEL